MPDPTGELETVLYEESDAIATVTLNRPERHNAINEKMSSELHSLWRWLRRRDAVRVVIVTAATRGSAEALRNNARRLKRSSR